MRLRLSYPPFTEWRVKQPDFANEFIVEGQLEQSLKLWHSCISHIKITDTSKCDGEYRRRNGEVLDTYRPSRYHASERCKKYRKDAKSKVVVVVGKDVTALIELWRVKWYKV